MTERMSKEEREKHRKHQVMVRDTEGASPVVRQRAEWQLSLLDSHDTADSRISELDTENQHIAELVSEVYLDITGGEISKPDTDPAVVLDYAREANEELRAEDLRLKNRRIAELESEVERTRERERWLRDVLACLPESVKEEALSDARAMRRNQ